MIFSVLSDPQAVGSVDILLQDMNDHSPVFNLDEYVGYVEEDNTNPKDDQTVFLVSCRSPALPEYSFFPTAFYSKSLCGCQ